MYASNNKFVFVYVCILYIHIYLYRFYSSWVFILNKISPFAKRDFVIAQVFEQKFLSIILFTIWAKFTLDISQHVIVFILYIQIFSEFILKICCNFFFVISSLFYIIHVFFFIPVFLRPCNVMKLPPRSICICVGVVVYM